MPRVKNPAVNESQKCEAPVVVVVTPTMNKETAAAEPKATKERSCRRRNSAIEKHFNEEHFKSFDKNGKNEFYKYLRQQVKEGGSDLIFDKHGQPRYELSGAFYELLWQVVRGTVKKESALQALSDAVAIKPEFAELILDMVNILDAETTPASADGKQDERLRFGDLVKDLNKVLPESLLKERLDIDTLQESGVFKNRTFYSKFIKVKTKLYYKQRRYNLFREESEGYAKLIVELNQDFPKDMTSERLMNIVKSLIGFFNLDPNRVLDIILESLENNHERWRLMLPLLRNYAAHSTKICEILGYKCSKFVNTRTPSSLLLLIALLLKHDIIELAEIYVWLTPADSEIETEWLKELAEAKEHVRKLNIVCQSKDGVSTETQKPLLEPELEENLAKYHLNQKLRLCEALLTIGDWPHAAQIIQKYPAYAVVRHGPIARSLIMLINVAIEDIYYRRYFNAPSTRTPLKSKLLDDRELMAQLCVRQPEDLQRFVWPIASTLGPALHKDTICMHKLLRMMRGILHDLGAEANSALSVQAPLYYEIATCLSDCILPALSCLEGYSPLAEEIWSVVSCYPYHIRYGLYARWKQHGYQMTPDLLRKRAHAERQIKAHMKRVSKENSKQIGRVICKQTHCAPGVIFDYLLVQVQIYDNLIGPIMESLKYLTSLSFDCLSYCIIEVLSDTRKNRCQVDGTTIAPWLQNLSAFVGSLYKKYNLELSGVLQYVANQLKSQRSLDLLILKDIVQKMAGVESVEEMTNDQLQALCGGELLRAEAGYFSQVRNTKRSSQRLKESLAHNDLAVALCLLMAQQKHSVIYRETTHCPLKLVGNLYDQCQDTLVQFGTFLGSTYSVDEYVARLPSVISMLQAYHIHSDVAFFLARPMFTHQINQKYEQLRRAEANPKKLSTLQKQQKYLEATNLIMAPIVESVRPLYGPKIWEDISPQFLVTFWSLSMYDLQVPNESYQRETARLKQLSIQALESKDFTASKNKKEQERYIALVEKLNDERKKQQEHVDKIQQRLQQQKDSWFLLRSAKSAKNDTITQFLQLCLFPRCTFTSLDSLYCAKFVHIIHNLKAANFATLLCYDRLFCDITYSVTSCTENEATRYGRFLCAMLETVMRWHSDEAIFNKECANYPGFVTKFRVSNQFSEANDNVDFQNYRHVCHKWHYKITKAIVFCLDSKEYMQIRNALIILIHILPHFPVLTKLAQIIERKVEKVRDEEKNKRQDLYVRAVSYIGKLKLKAAGMLKEIDFHAVQERANSNNSSGSGCGKEELDACSELSLAPVQNHETKEPLTTLATTATSSGHENGEALKLSDVSVTVPVSEPKVTAEKRTREAHDVEEQRASKLLKLSPQKATGVQQSCNSNSNSNNIVLVAGDEDEGECERERDREPIVDGVRQLVREGPCESGPDIIEIKDLEPERDRHDSNSRTLRDGGGGGGVRRDNKLRDERERERERDRERERHREREREREREHERERISFRREPSENHSERSSLRRDKRREDGGGGRYRAPSPITLLDSHNSLIEQRLHEVDYERGDGRGGRGERDLSPVSTESLSSLQPRRSHEYLDYEASKDSKRRKLLLEPSSVSSSKRQVDELVDSVKRSRGLKGGKERKDHRHTDDERKERKLGRKRERIDEPPPIGSGVSGGGGLPEHKRRRDGGGNGDDEGYNRDKYSRGGGGGGDKSPMHLRDRSYDKFDRQDRNMGGGNMRGDDRQYHRQRMNY